MVAETSGGWVRIGELSRRVGVSDHVLRAWERRYGLLDPVRTDAGYRLYSPQDERRVRRMRAHLAEGMSAAEAARAALREPDDVPAPTALTSPAPDSPPTPDEVARLRERITLALETLDEPAAQEALDTLMARLAVEDALRDVVLPYLHDLGDRWQQGEASVAQEHFATQIVRGVLTTLAKGWGRGTGPRALLACPPGERHDLALLAFGVVLARRGWSVRFLGADTPVASVAEAVERTRPDVVVLAATDPERFIAVEDLLADLSARLPVHLAGPGGTEAVARRTSARLLTADPVTAAQTLTV
ncbi:MAG TPA: cobalamin B12-binding domain-containing protein [Actinotalea sp.]|jgi:DNA-binding transcriptional MerR regulator